MPRTRSLRAFLLLPFAAIFSAYGGQPAEDQPILVKLHLELASKAALEASDIKFAAFPGGAHCALTYAGPQDPRTIAFLSKLGFRTTLYVNPAMEQDSIRALEDAGAEIAASPWGCKGTYSCFIGRNSTQESFDALATSRLALRKVCKTPVLSCHVGGHFSHNDHFAVSRNPEGAYGAAALDSNYLVLFYELAPYFVYLRREGDKADQLYFRREWSQNGISAGSVPNETIYYQALANLFLGAVTDDKEGAVLRFALRDLKDRDLAELEQIAGKYGKHPAIWHATDSQLAANEHIRKRVRIQGVEVTGNEAQITLAISRNLFPGFLQAPLALKFPQDLPVKSARLGLTPCPVLARPDRGVFIDVPLRQALRDACEMTLQTSASEMTVPDAMPVTLTLRNPSDKPLENARLEWVGLAGVSIEGGGAPFKLEPKGEIKISATIKTARGVRWGVTAVEALVTGTLGGEERRFVEGFEIVVAPRLRVDVAPLNRVPIPKDKDQAFLVYLANGKSDSPEGPEDKFVYYKTGASKGTVSFKLPEGMEAIPAEQNFVLPANGQTVLTFRVKNNQWGDKVERILPLIRFDGEKEPIETTCLGTAIVRKQQALEYKPLDEHGLLAYTSFDTTPDFDKSAGDSKSGNSGSPTILSNDGIKGWCASAKMGCLVDNFKNFNHEEGTLLFWMRRDPKVKNDYQSPGDPSKTWKMGVGCTNIGETIITTTGNGQIKDAAQTGLSVRRFPGWEDKPGYLEVVLRLMGQKFVYLQVPYDRQDIWRHVGVLWSLKEKRLELYLDGELASKADPGEGEWYGVPWNQGGPAVESFQIISCDHGKAVYTQRDEFYSYNRALKPDEISANRKLAKP